MTNGHKETVSLNVLNITCFIITNIQTSHSHQIRCNFDRRVI